MKTCRARRLIHASGKDSLTNKKLQTKQTQGPLTGFHLKDSQASSTDGIFSAVVLISATTTTLYHVISYIFNRFKAFKGLFVT